MTDRLSPLDAVHRSLGAKMVPFGGWDMPLSYPDGTLAEHRACRHGAVVFDVSHLGTVRVTGPDAFEVLQRAFTNDLHRVAPGRAQYTHLLDQDDASVVDDIIIWWVDSETFDVMPNASNTDRVTGALEQIVMSMDGITIDAGDITSERAILAVQGPQARSLLSTVDEAIASVGRFDVRRIEWEGVSLIVAGTGYTGEDGVEIAVPASRAAALWSALTSAGITSLQAGLGWAVRFDKGPFLGSEALAAERDRGVSRRLAGLVTEGRRPPREGSAVLRDGVVVGTVTSGNFSPELGHGIALALLPPDASVGERFSIDVRGTLLDGVVVEPPFVR
jgi:aminomethyltransferase